MINDFTFCALDLKITAFDLQTMLKEIISIDQEHWYYDAFRGCEILPLFNGGGTTGSPPPGVIRSNGELEWTPAGQQCPHIQYIVSTKVFPFMDPPGRMSILRTQKDCGLNVHIDSNKKSIGTSQHKFRIVLKGEIDKLYFIDENMNKVFVPNHYPCYSIDGTHPHSIDPGLEEKITICIGTPWRGSLTDQYSNLILNSPYIMKVNRPIVKDEWECK